MIDGEPHCPVSIDNNGVAIRTNMQKCGKSEACKDVSAIKGKAITIGYRTVGSYLNSGSRPLSINFQFDTGTADSSASNWNVEVGISAGFDAFGASFEASVTAGGGGESASTTSNHQTHTLAYEAPPRTQVFLKQKVLISGPFVSRTFDLILVEKKMDNSMPEESSRKLSSKDLKNLRSRNV